LNRTLRMECGGGEEEGEEQEVFHDA
jgi:hypothetical protein